MDEWTLIAYGAFGLSAVFSLARIGSWLLRADPQALAAAGRWSLLGLGSAVAAALLWLVLSGRWTLAMMLAAFVMPVFTQAASRWRALLAPRRGWTIRWPRGDAETAGRRPASPEVCDSMQVEEAAALLRAYLEQSSRFHRTAIDADRPMPAAEALDVLGLAPGAAAAEIREAHRRLRRLVDPAGGGTHGLALKIDEARDVLTETGELVRSATAPEDY